MRLCVFEDNGVEFLEPIALSRPAFDLRCGAGTLLERHRRLFGSYETGAWVRPALVERTRDLHSGMPVNDSAWLRDGPVILVNSRWLAPLDRLTDIDTPRVGVVGEQVAYVICPSFEWGDLQGGVEDFLARCRHQLPTTDASGRMLDFLWEFVDHTSEAICEDIEWFRQERKIQENFPPNLTVAGDLENFVLAEGATIEPFVSIDARQGPVLIDRGAVIHSFSRIEGPCYIGPDTWIMGAKIRAGTTLGPQCRIGGEVECSIVQGHTNKYHEGFLGHSYLGEWVNLAAATQTSDLRNDYGSVKVTVNGQRMSTGRTKVGSFIGDHTKSGLGVLLNTGSVIGAFCNLLASGTLLPSVVPSFCQVQYGHVVERFDVRQMFSTAATAMGRRGVELTDRDREFFDDLYGDTADRRRRTIGEIEARVSKRRV
jgi:UDP-N-acetylglucosamine diphosphorylase / glucose-1-phosphate thymidylyltransferase / UDP-N-acetylgalactosamine diphosphorylase / glucosamine-1-phosphate N-acetyltransferase / galactosamine-1-phosphate N-acetyltransferase